MSRPLTSPHPLIDDLIAIMRQGQSMIRALEPSRYSAAPAAMTCSPIGAHYRHHLEHVQRLVEGAPSGQVDYDLRQREVALERDPLAAHARTEQLIDALQALTCADLDCPIQVVHQSSLDPDARHAQPSTLGRELLFVLSHAVHHYALMAMIAKLHGLPAHDDAFGVMPSTLLHQERLRRERAADA